VSDDILTSPRLTDLLRMRRFLDAEIAEERRRLSTVDTPQVVRAAADLYGTTPEAIRGPARDKSIASARMVACWLLRQTGLSYPEIGRAVDRDHTTAIHACRVIDNDPTRLAIARQLLAQEVAA
jgi:chromosomal replication initiation ATPase DnaA